MDTGAPALQYNHIELFAGCGGLSLGLDRAGFELLFANELSPMASESFAYNFFSEDFEDLASSKKLPKKTLWLSSQFNNLKQRLRENPFNYPAINSTESHSDLPHDGNDLYGKLIVGNIVELNKIIDGNNNLKHIIRSGFGLGGVDLVSGGPPCQSFSMAGMRKKNCEKNTLPWEFATFVNYAKPKVALLENVTGILRPFKDDNGEQFYAWFEVAKVFASIGYVPICLHVNARMAGVPQNRPRFIMVNIREDVCHKIIKNIDAKGIDYKIFMNSLQFYLNVKKDQKNVLLDSLSCYDAASGKNIDIFKESIFLRHLITNDFNNAISVSDALDDIKQHNPSKKSEYVQRLNRTFKKTIKQTDSILFNHEFRSNSHIVKCRFRIYQVLQQINDRSITKNIVSVMKGEINKISEEAWEKVSIYSFINDNNHPIVFTEKYNFESYLRKFPTKKQTQKALSPHLPAPAALSIPDDACHYDENELRVLTVREMARIQSFPDDFIFRSKITTGGQMRKFEVPQYTQVGNAVPPLLGLALGETIKSILDLYNV